ncbi:MAG TPA: hypothetical protein VFF03_10435 [Rhodocyclaceae bacterium]|nr:hypothetical protein [Rhodocyclaceae bacterium]
MDYQAIEQAAAAILNYVQQHPNSADTAEGIHAWWIDWEGRIESPLVTEQALEYLERQHLMERVSIGNRVLWRRPRQVE